jgi:hypothetical protein
MTIILADMSLPDALADAVEANLAEQFAYFGRSPRAHIDESPELVRFLSGIPIPEYNGVIRARLAPLYRARELGYHIGVLQASEMGAGVYTRLGFRQVCSFSLYAWEPPIR